MGGTSVPDLILLPNSIYKHASNYKILWEANCGINSDSYKLALTNYALGPTNTPKQLELEACKFITHMQKALNSISKTTNKRKTPSDHDPTGTEHKVLEALLKSKSTLIREAKIGDKAYKANKWKEIFDIQKQIHEASIKIYNAQHKPIWNVLSAINCQDNAQRFWKYIKKLRNNEQGRDPFPSTLNNKGAILNTKQTIKDCITTYFSDVSEGKDEDATHFKTNFKPKTPVLEAPRASHKTGHVKHTDLQEIELAIQHQKTHTAGGTDKLTNESFQHLPHHMLDKLTVIINKAIDSSITPRQWQDSLVHLIFKKGEENKIENYRPIVLLNSIFKIWETVLLYRLKQAIEESNTISIHQFGSQPEIGAIDAILAINLLNESAKHLPILSATIDLSKAYNRVNRAQLWNTLGLAGVPRSLIQLIKSTYSEHCEVYKLGNDKTKHTKFEKGLRQGSVLSPILFIIFINDILTSLNDTGKGVLVPSNTDTGNTACLMFVDDLKAMSHTIEGLAEIIDTLIDKCLDKGLIINIKKSSISAFPKSKETEQALTLHPTLKWFKIKEDGVYLGAYNSPGPPDTFKHIRMRLAKAHSALQAMKQRGLHQNKVGRQTTAKIFSSINNPHSHLWNGSVPNDTNQLQCLG